MAIKFSQFVVETNKANVNYIVGWDGAENVQITPTDLLSGYPTFTGSTGQVAFFDTASSIGGDNDLFFDNTNKRLGIGTTSPSEKLEVQDGNIKIETTTNVDARLILNAYSDGIGNTYQWEVVGKGSTGNYNLQIREGSTPYVTIDNSISGNAGNVGIGTTSPSAKLEVDGTLIATGISQLGSGGANVYLTSSSAGNVGIGTSSPTARLDVRLSATTGKVAELHNNVGFGVGFAVEGDGGVNTINSESNQALAFATNGASNERMRIDSSGNVGIGTISPTTKLQVAGNSTYISVINTSNNKAIELGADSSGDGQIIMRDGSNNTKILFYAEANAINYINNGGNFGIGTTSPSEKLSVSGNSNITGKLAVGATAAHPSFDFYNQNSAYFNGAVTIDDNLTVSSGDVEISTIAKGLILKSPDGTRYRVTVANGGTLSVAAV